MPDNVQQQATLNFLVPSTGQTNVTAIGLPNLDIGSTDGYSIDWRSLNSFMQGQLFIPQACTICAAGLSPSITIAFAIPSIGFSKTIVGGTSPTFQFPALQDLVTTVTPSDGASAFTTLWYNYPALPDQGGGAGAASGSVPGAGTDHSANAPALAANLLVTVAANSSRSQYIVQNQSADTLQVVFDNGTSGGTIILLGPGGAGLQGGSINMSEFPFYGRIRVFGANAADQVAVREV